MAEVHGIVLMLKPVFEAQGVEMGIFALPLDEVGLVVDLLPLSHPAYLPPLVPDF